MLHPLKEFRQDILSSGFFYGSLIEAGAVMILLPGGFTYYPIWVLLLALFLALLGVGVQLWSAVEYAKSCKEEE